MLIFAAMSITITYLNRGRALILAGFVNGSRRVCSTSEFKPERGGYMRRDPFACPMKKITVRSHFDLLATFNKLAAHETMIVFHFANLKAP